MCRLGGLLLGLALGGPAWAQDPAAPDSASSEPASNLSWYAIPNVAYDSDDRLGFGARAEFAWSAPGHDPYKLALVFQGFSSVTGYHHHRVRIDRTGLGPRSGLRLTGHLAFRQWKNDGYWGIGNGTMLESAYAANFDLDDPLRKRYRYSLTQPFLHVVARQQLGDRDGPWSVYGALNPKWSRVQTYAISVLEAEQPYGMAGGFALQGLAGLLFDSRSPEIAPESGVLLELGGRVSPLIDGEAGGFAGPFASARGFVSPLSRLTLAGRVAGEWLFGDVPFYEMVHWGGFFPMQGFGGFETLRGVRFGRWRAPAKAIANLEARILVLEHPAGKSTLGWELTPFSDLGVVWGAAETASAPPPDQPLHPTVGLGLRLVFAGLFVGRLDYGLGWDRVVAADGAVSTQPSSGVYLVFDHPY